MLNYRATAVRLVWPFLLSFLLLPRGVAAQREPQTAPSGQDEYGARFFEQLRSLFGRFRDSDLQRAFEAAQPVQCSELISGNGEWRPVAFFNEDRKLGDWYHGSLEEVKGDVSTFTFKGSCTTEQSSVLLVTKFPVKESMERYSDGRIHFHEIAVNTNAAVRASFDPRSQAYTFELPYLYAARGRNSADMVYSLWATRSTDRTATDVTNKWDCKSVRANDLTFEFLICDTQMLPRNPDARSRSRASFGSAAYFILSDGKEASTSFKLSFGTAPAESPGQPAGRAETAPAAAPPDLPLSEGWQVPGSDSKLAEAGEREFRIRFNPQTWAGKIGSAQVLSNQNVTSLDPAKPPTAVDYCAWRPASASLVPRVLSNQPDADVAYTLTKTEGSRLAPVSISFELKTHNGSRLGTLQCLFPRAESSASISFERWVSVVGTHLTLEIHP